MTDAKMTHEEFLDTCAKRFGDKVKCEQLKFDVEAFVAEYAEVPHAREFIEAVCAYPAQAWLQPTGDKYECPVCSARLMGFLGSFTWGIVNGIGYCASCEQVEFLAVHRMSDEPWMVFTALAIYSFSEVDNG